MPLRTRKLDGFPGRRNGLFALRGVDVRPEGERCAGVADAAGGVQGGGGTEGTHGFRVVEAECQGQRLVEVALRLRFDHADGEVQGADAFQERCDGRRVSRLRGCRHWCRCEYQGDKGLAHVHVRCRSKVNADV